ncbi:Cell death activator CIDE-B [Labeo rohita]|uniref:Cell death activator CIDE-B n=1 Tax=Labeo rohita TaxID=84645 RepID=A0ABQ8MIU9_LABRO|nr:Cell death activator CIDE-B [Labeo rohita]
MAADIRRKGGAISCRADRGRGQYLGGYGHPLSVHSECVPGTERSKKGVTAGTLEELKEKAAQALLISTVLTLVCEEDGTEVDSEEGGNKPAESKPRTGKDIAQITFDLYRTHPKDVFGSLNVKATFQGLYSVSADFQCLGPKKVLREALRLMSSLLHAAGHLLISSAAVIRRIIHGADLLQAQQGKPIEYWE